MNRFDEALNELEQLCHADGMEDGLGEGLRGWEERKADIAAAAAALRAIHEEDEALIGELEKALTNGRNGGWGLVNLAEADAVLLRVANRNKPQQGGQDGLQQTD